MNIALAALALFLVALPGIAFRYSYRKISEKTKLPAQSIVDETIFGILVASVIHYVYLVHLNIFEVTNVGQSISYGDLLYIVSGRRAIDDTILRLGDRYVFWSVSGYFGLSTMTGLFLGFISKWLVRFTHLDLYVDKLRFPDPWFYILTGEERIVSELRDSGRASWWKVRKKVKSIAMVHATALVQQGQTVWLYGGVVEGYRCDGDRLDRLVLLHSYRLPLPENWSEEIENIYELGTKVGSENSIGYYPITSNLLILEYKDIKTLGLRFFNVDLVGNVDHSRNEENVRLEDSSRSGEVYVSVTKGNK